VGNEKMRPKLRIPASDKTSIPNSYPARTVKKVATCYLRIIPDREAVRPIPVFTGHKMVQVANLGFIADLERLQVAEKIEMSDLAIRSNAHLGA
jgi:hypothetical protein